MSGQNTMRRGNESNDDKLFQDNRLNLFGFSIIMLYPIFLLVINGVTFIHRKGWQKQVSE